MTATAEGAIAPALSAAELSRWGPGVEVEDLHSGSSGSLTIDLTVRLARRISELTDAGATGVVVVQGTDTIEDVAFLLDLLVPREIPIVLTGAMRAADAPGSDGEANLRDSVAAARSPKLATAGVLVCFAGDLHAARYVRKHHTVSPAAFSSKFGPVGSVREGKATLRLIPTEPLPHIPTPIGAELAHVALHRVAFGEDGRSLETLEGLGYDALVIEAFGGGHVPGPMMPAITRLAQVIPIYLASRTGDSVLERTYDYPGSEIDLRAVGVTATGGLGADRARLFLTLAITAAWTRERIASVLGAM